RVDSATSGRREEISNLRIRQQATAEVQEPESLEVAQIKRNLAPLKSVKAQGDANSFVIDIAGEYFNKEERQIVEATSDNLTLFATNAPEIKDTTTRAKFEQAANDIQAANKQLKETTYTLKDDKDDSTLRDVLRDRLRDAKTALATTEETILQSVASALTSDPTSALSFTASKRTIPTIEELAIVTSKLNYKDFARKLYPELSDIALDQLQEGVKQYLVQKQFVQHLERAIQQVDAVLASRDDADTLRNVLARTLESDRAYDLDAPHASVYLYIETVLNIKMRADQIRNIEKFIAGIEGGKELVLQMIMGAGKTSVLQPILGFLFARPDSLSCVDVPEALFEPVKEGLHKALGNAFRQYVYALPYERENAKDLKFLQTYYDTLLEVQSRGGCLLRTPRVKHSIITSLYEAYYDKDEKRINLIGKIVELLQLNEVVQIDEIDIAMNSKITFKYPVGDAVAVDKTRASMLSNLLLDAATDPELLQVASLDFANAYQTRNNKDFIRKGASLTPELFIDAVRPRLVQLALVRLNEAVENFGQKQAALGDYLTNFLTQSTPFDQEISEKIPLEAQTAILQQKDLSSYEPEWIRLMTEQAAYKSEMNKRVKSTFANQQDIELLGTVADALKNILPAALFKECGSNYGPDPEEGIYVARPYAAPKTPKVSVYADPYEQVIYTTEMVLYYGIPKDAAAKMLKQLQNLAKAEIKNHVALLETDAYKKFQKIMGEDANAFSLLETPPSEAFIDAYTKNASKNKESISEFLQHYVYPQIKTFEDSLLSTPQTLAGSSKLAYGYTGTLHTGILSRTQEACPEEGTDGKTILAIQSKMDKELAETQVYKEQDGKYPDQIIAQMAHDKDLYVFIDSGGWLKEEKIGEFAIRLLAAAKAERPEIEAIVYHNEKGQIVSLEPEFEGSDKLIEVPISSSRFKTTDGHQLTIIQQRYETGTNIPQKPAAKAVLSVRKGMIKREGLQSAFRMRQILYGQSVSYALTEEVKDYIAAGIIDGLLSRPQFRALFSKSGEITDAKIDALDLRHECKDALKNALQRYQTVAEPATMKGRISQFTKCFNALFEPDSVDIWGYKTANEALVEQSKNWDAGKQKMREVIEKPLRMLLADTKIPITTRKKAFELFQEFIIQTKKDSPFTKVTQESKFMSAEDAIEHEIQKHMKLLDLLKKDSEVSKLYYQKLGPDQSIEKQLKSCVKVEDIPAFLETAQSEGGQELEQEVEQEQEQEAQAEQEQEQELQVERVLPDAVQKPYVTIFKDPTIIPQFSTLTTLVGNLPLPDKDRIEFSPNLFIDNAKPDSAAHARYHLPGRYIMVIENPKRYVLVSTQDAAHIQKAIYGYPGTSKITLVSFDGKVVASKTNTPPDDELKRIALQAKIVCGKAGYSKDEIEHIDELLDHDKKKAQELQVFMEKMFSYLPHAAHTYSNSLLRSYFKKKTQVDH
ncbi:MAG: DUF3638 domain-containing protein, partial [Verrucomicrobia bacterium]|nr:DUF3638 domain-containing protein [Verrucomicrobiota bacterium]